MYEFLINSHDSNNTVLRYAFEDDPRDELKYISFNMFYAVDEDENCYSFSDCNDFEDFKSIMGFYCLNARNDFFIGEYASVYHDGEFDCEVLVDVEATTEYVGRI